MKLRPRTRNQIALAFSALVFIGVGVGIFVGARRSIADAALVAHTHEVIGRVDEIQAQILDAESAGRGYLLTSNQAYLADYQASGERLPVLLDQLGAQVSDNPVQTRNTVKLRALVKLRLQQIQYVLDLYERQGLQVARGAINRTVFRTTSAIREQAQVMVRIEQALLAQRARSSEQSANLLLALALAGIPFGLVVVAIAYGLLMRELRRRASAERQVVESNRELAGSIGKLERSSADLHQLGRYTGMLQSCANPEEALDITSRILAGLLPEMSGTVYLLRASQDRAEAISHWGEGVVQSAPHLAPDECWALRRGTPHVVDDLARDAVCAHVQLPPQGTGGGAAIATACIPMSAQGVQLGFLFLSGEGPGPLPRLQIAEAAAEQLSLALSNLRLRETLRRQSIRDPLTGLYNRRYLEESLNRELARSARRALPLSVLMLDVDHFKRFNDSHGHTGGDALLSAVGHLLATTLRSEDIACRYGGEEFTLILPEAGRDDAPQRGEQIRDAIARLSVSNGNLMLPPITASIGIATYPGDGDSGTDLLRKADAALYRAKRNGRNRVERYEAALDQG